MKAIGINGFSCSCCCKDLKPKDKVCVCTDCGAIFCEEYVKDGYFENHECDNAELFC